ncbi:DUF3618 domain-containing protein [Microtetraspora sp. AC03309]|uniref:DUF3618 domain-containing protein n=1 Tax=Microtetraspora sp. AC03309 TaxID=2779376 RepID=UPI001E3967C1|nr:DUF3618 domain-containing protein [Microtetraspora sp. AC03309]
MSETDPWLDRDDTAGEVGVHSQLVKGGAVSEPGDTLNESLQRVIVVWQPAEAEEAAVLADIERDRAELARTVAALASRLDVRRRAGEKARRAAGRTRPMLIVAVAGMAAAVLLRLLMRRGRRRPA